MKIGVNFRANNPVLWERASETGADYAEVSGWSYMQLDEFEFAAAEKNMKDSGIPIKTMNGLFIPELKLVGEDVTPAEEVKSYLEKCFARAERLGVKTAVWGSGKARSYEESFGRERAEEQLIETGIAVGDTAEKFGIRVAIEPLNHFETNIFYTVKEGAEFCRKINHPAVKLLADSYHMLVENESFDTLKDYSDVLIHAHIASGVAGRKDIREIPEKSDKYNIKAFLFALKDAGYNDTLTIEAGGKQDFILELKEGVEAIKSWDR